MVNFMLTSKLSIIAIFIVLVLGTNACSQSKDLCNKFSEPSIGVSFCAPSGWIIQKADDGYQTAFGEERNGFTPNMGVTTATATGSGSLSEFVKKGVEGLRQNPQYLKNASSVESIDYSEFAATSVSGYKIVYDFIGVENGKKGRSIQYIFDGKGNTKIIITGVK